jgi:hypothetical protein
MDGMEDAHRRNRPCRLAFNPANSMHNATCKPADRPVDRPANRAIAEELKGGVVG